MNSIAIMQPYFLPYIGYFQLLQAADIFVFYDDVQYKKNGWINRNRILSNGAARYITFPVKKDSLGKNINERFLTEDANKVKQKNLSFVMHAYNKAPYFHAVFPLLKTVIDNDENNVSSFSEQSILNVWKYLGKESQVIRSSEMEFDKTLRGQSRVIEVVKKLEGTRYINPIGGIDLYNPVDFKNNDIELKFIQSGPMQYKQYDNEFVPNLSIIDVLMFNSIKETQSLLKQYELVDGLVNEQTE